MPLPLEVMTYTKKPNTSPSRRPDRNPCPCQLSLKMTAFFFPAKRARRGPALRSLALISRATQRASAAIRAPASNGLIAAADAIATIAVAIVAVAVADRIVAAAVPAGVLDS